MPSHICQKIFLNIDIILNIYKFLDFEDQLRLSQVSVFHNNVFQNYVWREKYDSLKIFDKFPDFVVTNETKVNRMCLKIEGIRVFLNSYSDKVTKLEVRNVSQDDNQEMTHGRSIMEKQLDIGKFRNLNSLIYNAMVIPLDHLELVVKLFPKLEELRLLYCTMDNNDLNVLFEDVILKLKNLKTFYVYSNKSFLRLNYSHFHHFVCEGKIKCLKMTAMILPTDVPLSKDLSNKVPTNLKELRTGASFRPEKWSSNFRPYLRHFENLSSLRLFVADQVTDTILATIADTCQQLQRFRIEKSHFHGVKEFSLAPRVTDLNIYRCYGLSCDILQQLLMRKQITKFCSLATSYEGELQAFHVSPLIESLEVEDIFTNDLIKTIRCPSKLKSLVWHNPKLKCIHGISLESCKQLETLQIKQFYLNLNTIMALTFLQKLTIAHPVASLINDWGYIVTLLQHPPLREFTITDFHDTASDNCDDYEEMPLDGPNFSLTTNVTSLTIPLDICESAISFWLNVFSRNTNLTRLCCTFSCCVHYTSFLETLIEDYNFPTFLKTIDICGFTVNCRELRIDFDNVVKRLVNRLKDTKYSDNSDDYHILLQK